VVLIEYGFASRNTPQASSPIWGYRELNANTRISDIRNPCYASYAQTPIVCAARLATLMEGEGSLVLCADVIAIETVDSADDDAFINSADDDALTVVPGANRGLESCW
jgi:hypothetical protein